MSFIKNRLRRAEASARKGSGHRCQECRLPPHGPGYIVLIDEENPERSFQGDPDERCGRCERYLYQVIRVVYGDPPVEEGGGGVSYGAL